MTSPAHPTPEPDPDPDPDPLESVVTVLRAAGCVFAEDEARLLAEAAAGAAELDALVARRVAGQPLEQLLGWAEFAGLRVAVAAGVFVPRRRTELLAAQAIRAVPPGGIVVELCCGVAAVGAAVLAARADVEVHAADLDPAAARCARRNLGARGHVYTGDLFTALPPALRGRVDVLVANAPYVPTAAIATMPPEARLHEPRLALDGGADGLDVQRRIVASAAGWLRPAGDPADGPGRAPGGGRLLIETSRAQAAGTCALAEAAGLVARTVRDEELDATAVLARVPG